MGNTARFILAFLICGVNSGCGRSVDLSKLNFQEPSPEANVSPSPSPEPNIPEDDGVSITVVPTSGSVLSGSVRQIYSNVQGHENANVTWSTNGGSIGASSGYATWTAPGTSGTYTVTATSAASPGKSATMTFTVISNATVRLSNIPAHATVFRNQPVIIQSIIWGSTQTGVNWSASGGTLRGTGREVVFTAATTGTYTVTATSLADGTKTATTTLVVTDNAWPGVATANKTQPIDCTAGTGTTYDVTTEAEMNAVPWSTLGPGDTVRIHPGTYHKQILLSSSGTEAQPIRICGIADGAGNLPVLDGANATAKAGSNYGSGAGNMQPYEGILIYNRDAGYFAGASYPKNIIIEGLKITGFNRDNTYTDLSTGLVTSYNKAAAPIRVQHGGNITVRGNELSFNGNGLFTMSKNSVESNTTRNLLIEGNYIHDNGVPSDYLEHQSYLQAFGLVVQGNYYDHPLTGMPGGQLKTRSVQQFIRYNYFEGASRILDLVEIQDSPGLVFPWVGVPASEQINTSASDIVANYEAYHYRFVYGNIIHNVGSPFGAWIFHGAGDNTQSLNPGGTLHAYHNSIFSDVNSSSWRSGLIDFGPYGGAVTANAAWPTARLANNAIWLTGLSPKLFFWNRYKADRVILDTNWVTSDWGTGNLAGGDGTGIGATTVAATSVWQGGQLATQVIGLANLLTGSLIPFDSSTYAPSPGSPLLQCAAPLTGMAATLPPLMQYSPVTRVMKSRSDSQDLGAVAFEGD